MTAPYTFTFDTPPAPELLAQWCFEVLATAAWTNCRTACEYVEAKHGRKLTRDEAREYAMDAFQVVLDGMPEANPFRPALERFIGEYVLPTLDEESTPAAPPKLRLVP